jgi:hypothetical protein
MLDDQQHALTDQRRREADAVELAGLREKAELLEWLMKLMETQQVAYLHGRVFQHWAKGFEWFHADADLKTFSGPDLLSALRAARGGR